jgi:hypothetical protein
MIPEQHGLVAASVLAEGGIGVNTFRWREIMGNVGSAIGGIVERVD